MLIKVIKDVAGENLIEKNRNRRDMIVKNANNNANILVNKLYSCKNENEFKTVLVKEVLYEALPDDLVNKLYKSNLSKKQFLEWYVNRGQEGFWDLVRQYELYKEWN